jgi:hypothetical protein
MTGCKDRLLAMLDRLAAYVLRAGVGIVITAFSAVAPNATTTRSFVV